MWKPNFEMNSLMTPALYVESGVEGMCLDNPSDGNAYLRMVIAERAQCEETVTANIDLEKIGNQHIYVEEPPNIPTLPKYLRPTIEFQNFQIADFSNLRQLVSRLTKVAHLQKWKSPESVTVPNIEHSDNQIWREFFKNTEPELKLLVSMSQPVLEHSLEVLIEALDEVPEGNGIGIQCGRWLYSVLACLKLPLDAETCSLLRDLARRCGEIRSHIALDSKNISELIMPLNVMICLVARYFRQNDLAD